MCTEEKAHAEQHQRQNRPLSKLDNIVSGDTQSPQEKQTRVGRTAVGNSWRWTAGK